MVHSNQFYTAMFGYYCISKDILPSKIFVYESLLLSSCEYEKLICRAENIFLKIQQ